MRYFIIFISLIFMSFGAARAKADKRRRLCGRQSQAYKNVAQLPNPARIDAKARWQPYFATSASRWCSKGTQPDPR